MWKKTHRQKENRVREAKDKSEKNKWARQLNKGSFAQGLKEGDEEGSVVGLVCRIHGGSGQKRNGDELYTQERREQKWRAKILEGGRQAYNRVHFWEPERQAGRQAGWLAGWMASEHGQVARKREVIKDSSTNFRTSTARRGAATRLLNS